MLEPFYNGYDAESKDMYNRWNMLVCRADEGVVQVPGAVEPVLAHRGGLSPHHRHAHVVKLPETLVLETEKNVLYLSINQSINQSIQSINKSILMSELKPSVLG